MERSKPKFGKVARISSMIVLTLSYFVVEIVVGNVTGSIALVADSFHMLSDVVALAVGLAAVRISKMDSSKSTFGWVRAEVLGALVNAVFLLALCFSIFVDSVQRLVKPEEIHNLPLLLIVGSVGLGINLVGLLIFHDHPHGHSHGGHSHGSHSHGGGHSQGDQSHGGHSHGGDHSQGSHSHGGGHSHGGHSHGGHSHGGGHFHDDHPHGCDSGRSQETQQQQLGTNVAIVVENDSIEYGEVSHNPFGGSSIEEKSLDEISNSASNRQLCTDRPGTGQPPAACGSGDTVMTRSIDRSKKEKRQKSSEQLNMRGIFLHVLGDALGSVVVMISALLIMYVPDGESHINWKPYIDPVLSLVLVAIIVATTVPLLKESALILLQAVTTPLSVGEMKVAIEKMEGVLAVHELHVWQLAGTRHVASLHLSVVNLDDYVRLSSRIKNYFHDSGVHSVTIQPEFDELQTKKAGRDCALECGPDLSCYMDTCCGKKLVPGMPPQLLLQLIEAAETEAQDLEAAAATRAAPSAAETLATHADEDYRCEPPARQGIWLPGSSSIQGDDRIVTETTAGTGPESCLRL